MHTFINNRGFSLIELMMAVAFSVILMAGVFSFYNTSNQVYSSGISGQTLQNGANVILSKIMEGDTESGTVYRLATSETFTVANGTTGSNTNALYSCGGLAQSTPCNTSNPSGEIYFCQDNPSANTPSTNCNYTDSTARWYYLNSAGTSIMYHSPVSGGSKETSIYTAPADSSLTLRFSPAAWNGVTLPNVVEIDVALTQNVSASITNLRVTSSGAASTFVLLRNHP